MLSRAVVVNVGHIRQIKFRRLELAEFVCVAPFFAGDDGGLLLGGAWDGRAAAGGRAALGRNRF